MGTPFQSYTNNPNLFSPISNDNQPPKNEISNMNNVNKVNINNPSIAPRLHNLLNSTNSTTSNPASFPSTTYPSSTMSSPLSASTGPDENNNNATINNSDKSSVPLQKKKARRKSSNAEEKALLSTSSPEGIAAASEITPNRIANILLKQGPLPIRHLTGHLVDQVPPFGNLSLSKQRRLIMSALESGDLITGCIFEKIGWGQWEAKLVGKDIVRAKIELSFNNQNQNEAQNNNHSNVTNVNFENDSQTPISAINSSKYNPIRPSSYSNNRRESITGHLNDNSIKIPTSPTLGPIQNLRNSFTKYGDIDEAIDSSSSSNDDDDDDVDDDDDADDNDDDVFNLSGSADSPPNIDYSAAIRNSTTKLTNIKSQSTSSSRRPSFAGIVKPRKPRTSFTQHTLEVALDEAPLERRESRVSFSNSASLSRQSFLRTNILPRMLSSNNSNISLLDKDNENAITFDNDEPDIKQTGLSPDTDGTNHTDEEDWQAIGPTTLKKNRTLSMVNTTNNIQNQSQSQTKTPEEMAAFALMDLKTV